MTDRINRRNFLTKGAIGGAATVAGAALAAPAVAQELPTIKWRLTSGFPNNLDTIYGGAVVMSQALSKITGGKFEIQVFQAGEIVPGPQAIDAVKANTVEIAHTCGYYFTGKDPTFAIGSTIPFGLNGRQQNAWLYHGGGNEAYNEFLADYGVIGVPGGATGAQMGGWFRKEIKGLADLKGVKMRIAGVAGEVMSRLGVVPQQLPGGDIYPALERGTIDAAEWIGPYDDERLGFYQIAPNYYYPAYWEGGLTIHFFINKAQYEGLPDAYKAALDAACKAANINMQALYDVKNTTAIRSLVGKGVKLRPLPRDVMDAAYKTTFELYAEYSAKHPAWAKIYPGWKKFRDESFEWFRVAEYSYDSYMYAAQASGK
ncbi:TRAP-type mannitol/chloroaromatic compound transport system substrate-binding protein [Neorhizobium huautlense]|uniref:TRAP-type mannitol/chloroaromatic compound transport system substrate-binding protein n=1 Tax=Neorhizobium huautlense TaxID=67774 RepID=A0ABT9Q1R2_9HYPH|nr:TRAP transporter substrate-binding protein [Neorhizobium huautlense]MDP9840668.1 TRAP-type mannitol/chloroaromatic compound transport system substrate-binding protein [Neorhizobium huautlense]